MKTLQSTSTSKPVNVSTRLPPELAERLRKAAFERRISQSLLILEAIKFHLDNA